MFPFVLLVDVAQEMGALIALAEQRSVTCDCEGHFNWTHEFIHTFILVFIHAVLMKNKNSIAVTTYFVLYKSPKHDHLGSFLFFQTQFLIWRY